MNQKKKKELCLTQLLMNQWICKKILLTSASSYIIRVTIGVSFLTHTGIWGLVPFSVWVWTVWNKNQWLLKISERKSFLFKIFQTTQYSTGIQKSPRALLARYKSVYFIQFIQLLLSNLKKIIIVGSSAPSQLFFGITTWYLIQAFR